jgi:hypothetical protein
MGAPAEGSGTTAACLGATQHRPGTRNLWDLDNALGPLPYCTSSAYYTCSRVTSDKRSARAAMAVAVSSCAKSDAKSEKI